MNPDNPRLVSKVVCYQKELISGGGAFERLKQGIQLGDIGLVVSQSVTELQVLVKNQVAFFHISEVEAL